MRAAVVAVVATFAVAGCTDDETSAPTTTRAADPPAPLSYSGPVDEGPVPAWLEKVKPTGGIGHWRRAVASPDGATLLAQYSAECEVPLAYFVDVATREVTPVSPAAQESVAVAWNDDGRAGVFFPGGGCGTGNERPGLYLVSLDGRLEFVTDDVAEVERWQAERVP